MKTKLLVLATLLSSLANASAIKANVLIDPALVGFAKDQKSTSFKNVLVTLEETSRPNAIRYNSEEVLNSMMNRTTESVATFTAKLSAAKALGKDVIILDSFWINNSVLVSTNAQGLKTLASIANVRKIYVDGSIQQVNPFSKGDMTSLNTEAVYNYNFKDTNLEKLITTNPEVNGTGVVLGSIDTGVQGSHPAIAGKVKLFYDAAKGKLVEPFDEDEHGTHTVGIMLGGSYDKNPIGMAPGAKVVATAALSGFSSMLKGMQWILNPDMKNDTKDQPVATNMSWKCEGAPDIELFYKAIDAMEAAGVLPVFSAGNAGPNDMTITPPHEHPLAFAVGATGANGLVTSFSSRGPGKYHGQYTNKPELTAPGHEIYSSVPAGRYVKMSGTSMAAPHVTGATALVKQVFPELNPAQIRKVFLSTLKKVDVNGKPVTGTATWNKNYGLGRLDVYAAVQKAIKMKKKATAPKKTTLMSAFGLDIADELDTQFILAEGENTLFDPTAFETDAGEMVRAADIWE